MKCHHIFLVQYIEVTLDGYLNTQAFWENAEKLAKDPTKRINIDVVFSPTLQHGSTPPSDNQSRIFADIDSSLLAKPPRTTSSRIRTYRNYSIGCS